MKVIVERPEYLELLESLAQQWVQGEIWKSFPFRLNPTGDIIPGPTGARIVCHNTMAFAKGVK